MITEHLRGHRVLVTGATGFVGRHLIARLLADPDIEVRALARSDRRVSEVLTPKNDRLQVVAGDIMDPDAVAAACHGVDVVIHAAALCPTKYRKDHAPEDYRRVNVDGTREVARAALRLGVQRFVLVSSTAAMGAPTDELVSEETFCHPTSPYGLSKLAAENALLEVVANGPITATIVRPCLVVGKGVSGGELLKLFKLCRRGMFPVVGGRLDIQKPLIAVEDLVQALLLATAGGQPQAVYLVHSGTRHTLRAILAVSGALVGNPRPYMNIPLPLAHAAAWLTTPVARLAGRPPPLSRQRLGLFIADRRIDIGKAVRELGYVPRHRNLREMLARTHAGYVDSGQL